MLNEGKSVLDVKLPLSGSGWAPQKLRGVVGRTAQVADLVILGAAFFGIIVLPFLHHRDMQFSEFLQLRISLRNVLVAVACLSAWRMVLWMFGIYSPQRTRSLWDYLFRCWTALTVCTVILAAVQFLLKPEWPLLRSMTLFWGMSAALMLGVRVLLYLFNRFLRPLFRQKRNLLIIGTGPRALKVYNDLKAHTELNYTLLGFIDHDLQPGFIPKELFLGSTEDLEAYLMREIVDEVIIALPMRSNYEAIGRAIAICEQLGIQSQYPTDQFGGVVTKRRYNAGPQSGRVVLQMVHNDYRHHLKRLIDVGGALAGLIVLSPLLLATALAVKFTSKGPIIFKQERFGLNKRLFFMLKFRSMVIDAEARQAQLEHLNEISGPAFKIKKDPRITPVGAILRKLSIDELPQLVNVLRGDMSLVGPRPLPMRDVSRFSESWLMRRFSVKPGCTCLWQIMGRSNTDFDRWIELDLQYIDNWSLSLDLLILAKTLPAVLFGRGAS